MTDQADTDPAQRHYRSQAPAACVLASCQHYATATPRGKEMIQVQARRAVAKVVAQDLLCGCRISFTC